MIHIYLPTKSSELKEITDRVIVKIDNLFFKKRKINKMILKLSFETNAAKKQLEIMQDSSLRYLMPKYPMSFQDSKNWEEKYGNKHRKLLCLFGAIENLFCLINWARKKTANGKLFWNEAHNTLKVAENILIFINQDMAVLKKFGR